MLDEKISFIDRYAGLLTFFLVYSYALSFIVDIMFSTSNHVLVYFTVLFAGLILCFSFLELLNTRYVFRYAFVIVNFALFFLFFLYLTKINYVDVTGSFDGVFNSFLARAFPCIVAGLLVGKRDRLLKLDKFIFPVIILVSITLLYTVLKNPSGDISKFVQLGIDRQTLSYVASYMIIWGMYFLVNFERMNLPHWQRTRACKAMVVFVIISDVWPLLAGGGRGAVVLLAFFFAYYVLYRIKPLKSIKGIIGGIIFIIVIVFIWNYLSRISSLALGLERITSFFTGTLDRSALERVEIYRNAVDLFSLHPILGGGPGYALCQMGIWSHNIFLDLLVDVGIVGTVIFVIWLADCFIVVFKNARSDRNIEAGFILGMTSFIMLCFSGSYISDGGLWFFLSYCIAYKHNHGCKLRENR